MAAEPKYQQIADHLRARIEGGLLEPGAQLPIESDLMTEYSASRNTVRDAMRLLVSRGLVETRPGQGTFVTEKIHPFVTVLTGKIGPSVSGGDVYVSEVRASGRRPDSGPVRVGIENADATIADALRIAEGTSVITRHQQRFIDETPWVLETTFYPMRLLAEGGQRLLDAADISQGTIRYLAEECGIKQVGYRDSLSVRVPDDNEVAFFRLPPDGRIPVFVHFRIGFDQNGDRFRLTVTVYPADRNRFVINVGQVPPRGEAGGGQ